MMRDIRFGITVLITSLILMVSMPCVSAELFGDANGDKQINTLDVTMIERMILTNDEESPLADANQDGSINIEDVTYTESIILDRVGFPGGHMNIGHIFGPEYTLDPAKQWTGGYIRQAGIAETLFYYNEDLELTPELATGYTELSDTQWQIHLRKGVTFHDGTPFNADAVVYSIERVTDESNSRRNEYKHIESIVAEDEYTVTITTTGPCAYTIATLTDPLVSMVSPAAGEAGLLNTTPVCTGPFKYKSNEPSVSMSVVRNENYWGGKAKLESAMLYYLSEGDTRSIMLQSGDIDITLGLPLPIISKLESDSDLNIVTDETLRLYFLFVNNEKAPLDDIRVRQAINYAINREQIVDAALEGIGGVSAIGMFPSVFPWTNDALTGYPYDKDKALSLLEEAGITDNDNDGILEYNGEDFQLTIELYSSRAVMQPSAEIMGIQLEDIGIDVKIQFLESAAIKEDMVSGNYDLAFYSYNSAQIGDPDRYLTNHFDSTASFMENQWIRYSNDTVNSLLADAEMAMNQSERKGYYDQVQAIIVEQSPEMFIFHERQQVGHYVDVIGYVLYPNEITFLTKEMYMG
jgi:peptide/nickel transport system substrate-binding protein